MIWSRRSSLVMHPSWTMTRETLRLTPRWRSVALLTRQPLAVRLRLRHRPAVERVRGEDDRILVRFWVGPWRFEAFLGVWWYWRCCLIVRAGVGSRWFEGLIFVQLSRHLGDFGITSRWFERNVRFWCCFCWKNIVCRVVCCCVRTESGRFIAHFGWLFHYVPRMNFFPGAFQIVLVWDKQNESDANDENESNDPAKHQS